MGKLVRALGSIEQTLHRKDIVDLAKDNAQSIIDANKYDLLKVFIELKRYETYLKGLIQHLKIPALNAAKARGQKAFEYNEARISISTRKKWDFSSDDKWKELDQKIQQLTKEKKERERYLKVNNKVRETLDEDTGEIIEEFKLPMELQYSIAVRL